jgi:hypothetical protein
MLINGKDTLLGSSFLGEISRNGWNHVINYDAKKTDSVEMSWTLSLPDNDYVYDLSFFSSGEAAKFFINKEELNSADTAIEKESSCNYFTFHTKEKNSGFFSLSQTKGNPNIRLPLTLAHNDSIFSQFKEVVFADPDLYNDAELRNTLSPLLERIESFFKGFMSYSCSNFDLKSIITPADIKTKGSTLDKNASNLVNVINHYKSKDVYFMRSFESRLKEIMPLLEVVDVSSQFEKLLLNIGYNNHQFDLSDLSEGTIHAVVLAMLLSMSDRFTILALDEPEINLHPAWQKTVASWIMNSDKSKQFFISSHSTDFLDIFTDGLESGDVGVFVFDPIYSNQIIKRDYGRMKDEIQNGWTIGDLYKVNDPSLGGWPW